MSARDGEVLNKKQETMGSPLMGPLQCKGAFVYALAQEGYWICRMPLQGDHITISLPTCLLYSKLCSCTGDSLIIINHYQSCP